MPAPTPGTGVSIYLSVPLNHNLDILYMKIIITFDIIEFVGDSERYIKRGNDKIQCRRLKGEERIFKDYQSSSNNVLQVVDKDNRSFHVKSETSPDVWYNV